MNSDQTSDSIVTSAECVGSEFGTQDHRRGSTHGWYRLIRHGTEGEYLWSISNGITTNMNEQLIRPIGLIDQLGNCKWALSRMMDLV